MGRATECSTIPAKVVASCFALVAFAAAVVVGLSVGNAVATIIYRATLIMLGCWAIGYAVGLIGQYVLDQRIASYKAAHPTPGGKRGASSGDGASTNASGSGGQG